MDRQHYCPALAQGDFKHFKTYVCNRVSNILELFGPKCWHHVGRMINLADCVSRGLFPSELISHELWLEGPEWLKHPLSQWLDQSRIPEPCSVPEEEREICFTSVVQPVEPVIAIENFSSFTRLKKVTAWIMRFVSKCARRQRITSVPPLSVQKLQEAENYWLSTVHQHHFAVEIVHLRRDHQLHKSNSLISPSSVHGR